MKKANNILVYLFCLIGISNTLLNAQGLILPMPGQKPNNQPAYNEKKQDNTNYNKPTVSYGDTNGRQPQKQPSQNSLKTINSEGSINDSSNTILPMPKENKNKPDVIKAQRENSSNKLDKNRDLSGAEKSLIISLPSSDPNKKDLSDKDIDISDNLSDGFNGNSEESLPNFPNTNTNSEIDNLIPSTNSDTTIAKDASGENIKVYPKDTGAAVFMVMKSWNCEDYDIVSLINQALEVYNKDAGEEFQIKGLENITAGLQVSVEEEDITFDELLDIMASKSGNDWGCDIQNRTIYVYPKGIKTDSFLSWD